ncbi:MAG: hypothetical protein GXY23_03580 [Myxococcales bacterium]|jgi:hypothetical protein|nr:hypothetical protein [Myxococcales bacterium]
MRTLLFISLCATLVGCTDDETPVFGSGAFRFHDLNVISRSCSEADHPRIIAGEHGDETPGGGTLIARCAATEFASGDLSFNVLLDNDAGDSIDIRALRIPALPSGAGPVEVTPTGCESILFEVSNVRYRAVCTSSEPEEGECQLVRAVLDRADASISLDFRCHAVPTIGGGGSTCEVSGAGASANANLTFEACRGL